MHCENIQQQLDDYLAGELPEAGRDAINTHLQHCSHCQQVFLQTQKLLLALHTMPVTPARAGYAQRVLDFLPHPAGKSSLVVRRPLWFVSGFATAIIAMFVVLFLFPRPPSLPLQRAAVLTIHVASHQLHNVDLVFHSPMQISQATLRIDLPAGVEINGYARQRVLQWQTNLKQGANRLVLPLLVKTQAGGVLTARLSHNGKSRTFRVNIVTDATTSQRRSMSQHV
ncbi:MAG: zf-HC2 domain-containing protein [Gammaproteobacteria bacterium]